MVASNANRRLFDQEVRHQVGLRRLSQATARKAVALIERTVDDLVERMRALDPDRPDARARLFTLLDAWVRRLAGLETALERTVGEEMVELAAYEAAFNTRNIAAAAGAGFNAPTTASVVAAVNSRPFQGRFLREWMQGLTAAHGARVRDAVRIGYLEGEGIDAIVRRIRGTRARRYKDGAVEVSRRDATRIVRTAITHTANAASEEAYRAAGDLIIGVRYIAILDSRTSTICAGLDGEVFPVGEGPRPPQHHSCRSSSAPVIRGAPPPQRESYSEWLTRQPREVQDEILGPSRAKLFRAGLPITRFTDRAGREWTLDELRRREARAWGRAGLETV